MTEDKDTTPPETVDTDTERDAGEPDGTNDWKSRFEGATKDRDAVRKQNRILKEKLAALESQQNSRDKDDAEKSGDIAKIRTEYQKEVDALNEKLAGSEAQLKRVIVENKFKSIASKWILDEAIEDAWRLSQDEFDIEGDDDGNLIPVVKGKLVSIEERIKQLATERPYIAKNPKKKGSGPTGPGERNDGSDVDLSALKSMTESQKAEFLAKHPELLKKVFASYG